MAALRTRLTRINPAQQHRALSISARSPSLKCWILRGFNLNAKLELDPDFLQAEEEHEHEHDHEHDETDHVHDENCQHDHHDHHHAHHSDDIAAFVFKSTRPFDTAKLDEFLGGLVQVFGPRMLRYKGVLLMDGADRKVIFQGVHQIMGTDVGGKWADEELRESKMVFIGKNLPKDIFIEGLSQCLV